MSDREFNDQPSSAGKGKLIVALLVVIALAIFIIWYLSQDTQQKPKTIEQPVVVSQPQEEQPELVAEPAETVELGEPTPVEEETPAEPVEPARELPPLTESTGEIVERLRAEDQVVEPLQSQQLIRDAVVFVDNIRNGVIVKEAAVVQGPKAQFRVLEQDGKIYIDPRSYDRYNTLVDWFVSLDTEVLVRLLEDYQPLVKQALSEIGYPDTAPETVLVEAIDVLMQTPSVGTVIELSDESVMYRYADPALEALPDAQKQMLRLGPDNMRRVKLKLENLRNALMQAE